MISLESAQKLKKAGLHWQPALHDFFAIPERSMDEHVFVIGDMLTTVEQIQGLRVIAFQGASEWALDDLAVTEAIWMPREDQVRAMIESALLEYGRSETRLDGGPNGYTCTIQINGETLKFHSHQAIEAYSAALLYLLNLSSQESL